MTDIYRDPKGGFFLRMPGNSLTFGAGSDPLREQSTAYNFQTGRTMVNPYDTMMPSFYGDPRTGRLYNLQGQQVDPRDVITLPGGQMVPRSMDVRYATGAPTPGVIDANNLPANMRFAPATAAPAPATGMMALQNHGLIRPVGTK